MTMQKGNDLSKKEIDSMEIAVREAGIRSIHPDRMEAFASYLVKKLSNENPGQTTKTSDCTYSGGKSSCIDGGDGV